MKKELFKFPLNIQLFADGGAGDGGNGGNGGDGGNDKTGDKTPPVTYSKEEYDKLKASFDKASSDLAKMKKEATARLTDDEKKAKEQAEKEAHYKELETKVLKADMRAELVASGLEDNSISKIIEEATKENLSMVDLSKIIATEVKNALAKAKEEAKKEFQKGGTIPPAGKGDGKGNVDPFIEAMQNRKNGNVSARDYYFKPKK